ncbi:hypothetical protein [Halarchaeum salinum]|uniref:DUF8060 domain-containing protein n=1 Tax=Halarchaeum salinum TaxID=489912 RepID=A0AAV3S961_9EURY
MSDDERAAADAATETGAGATAKPSRDADADGSDQPPGVVDPDGLTLRRGARWLGIGIAGLVALVACVSLYGAVGTIISQWVAPRYQPLYGAAFDVVVLLLAAAVVARLTRGTDAF